MDNSYQHSTIAQILENILEQFTFEGESRSNIADILLSILNKTEYNEDPHSVIGDLLIRLKAKIEGESYDPYDAAYTSRIAEILISILEETEYTEEPQSRIAELLLELKEELEAYTELTASGSVASFITNVVKPLVNGEFTIAAYQEGSGDPSPVNVRNIVGFSEQNITNAHKNLFDGNFPNASTTIQYMHIRVNNGAWTLSGNAPLNPYIVYLLAGKVTTGASGSTAVYTNRPLTVNGIGGYITIAYRAFQGHDPNNYNFQLEGGNEATSYEPYVTPEVKTKQLGETVYGGSYNSVSGNKSKTWDKFKIRDFTWVYNSASAYFAANTTGKAFGSTNLICEVLTIDTRSSGSMANYTIKGADSAERIIIKDTNATSSTELINDIGDYYIAFELAEPIESNIGATPIETYDGSNNIFCDTGDTSVTYLYKGTPPETLTRVLSKSPDVEDIIKEEKLEDLKDLDELQDPDISDKEVK